MAATTISFAERMRCVCQLASLRSDADDLSSANLADMVSYELHRRVRTDEIESWRIGQTVPDASTRGAVAVALGFAEYGPYLASDDADIVDPVHTQVETFQALADNRTGLVALRRRKPVDAAALAALRNLA